MLTLPTILANSSVPTSHHANVTTADFARNCNRANVCFDFSLGYSPQVYNRLREIKQLEYNWDGYGAEAPLPTVVERTYGFVDVLANKYPRALGEQLMYPNPSGTITIEWERGDKVVSLEIGVSTANFFYSGEEYIKEEYIQNIDKEIPASLIKALMRLLRA